MTKKELAAALRRQARARGHRQSVIAYTFPTDISIILCAATCVDCGKQMVPDATLTTLIKEATSADDFRQRVRQAQIDEHRILN